MWIAAAAAQAPAAVQSAPAPVTAGSAAAGQSAPVSNAETGTSSNGAPAARPPATQAEPARRKPAAAATPSVSEVTVTGAAQAYRSSIDRKSYSLANDLQATTGSLADALRNIPSVDVDVQGNLSLRGDTSVTILVDGQPSALFQGPQRADALQQLPADQYERVEVMTNPSAAFKPDGTGGIINLITKKSAGAARTGTVKLNIGNDDRVNASVSGGYNSKRLSLSGGGGVRHDDNANDQSSDRQVIDPLTGQFTRQTSTGFQHGDSTSLNARGGLDYDLDAHTRLSASVFGFDSRFNQDGQNAFRSAALSGPTAQDYDLRIRFNGEFSGGGGSATWLRRFSGDGHELSVRLSHNEVSGNFGGTFAYDYLRPTAATLFQDTRNLNDNASTELKAEYKRPLPGEAKLVAGYELNVEDDAYAHQGRLGPTEGTAVATPGLNNVFDITQAVHAWYATLEKPLGKLTVLPGLRLEEVVIDSDQKTSAVTDHWSYFNAYPTLHLAYKLDELRTLSASFSRRVSRPNLQNLNPYLIYNGPLSYSQGNARLRPAVTESYELGWEFRKGQTYRQATLFFRDNHDTPEDVTRDLGGGVLLDTQANLGSSRNLGLELVANGKLWKTLGYNASLTTSYNEIDPAGLAFTVARSNVTARGRISLSWDVTKSDFLQFNYNATGERLTSQGYIEPSFFATLGYRHKFSDKLALVATANDPFAQSNYTTVIDTPQLKQRNIYRPHSQAFYVGLTYAFGAPGKRRAPDAFDFGGGGGAPGAPGP